LVDVVVDGVECGAEPWWGLGLVGGEEWPQDSVVDFAVEDREDKIYADRASDLGTPVTVVS
jgi:hypothetical protein